MKSIKFDSNSIQNIVVMNIVVAKFEDFLSKPSSEDTQKIIFPTSWIELRFNMYFIIITIFFHVTWFDILSIWSNDNLESVFRSIGMMQTSFSFTFMTFYLLSFCHGAPSPAFLQSVLSGKGIKEESRLLKRSGMFNFSILLHSSLYLRYLPEFLKLQFILIWLSSIHTAFLPELIEIFKVVENRDFTGISYSCKIAIFLFL